MATSDNDIHCDHSLGRSTMGFVSLTPDFIHRKCKVCGFQEHLPRAGKLWIGVDPQAEAYRDKERREYAKDILQPKDKRGKIDELYHHAWGNPYKESKVGQAVDSYREK